VKPRSTQRKKSAVARTSQSAGRSDYRAWSGGIAALLEENPPINTRLQPGVAHAKCRRAVLTACRPHEKPLKRFPASTRCNTGLKSGVNERQIVQAASEQSNILPTVSAKSSSSISQTVSEKFLLSANCQTMSGKSSSKQIPPTVSAEFEICGTASHKSAGAEKCQTMSDKSPVSISATPSRKLDAEQIVQTLSGKSSTLHLHQPARISRAPDAPKII